MNHDNMLMQLGSEKWVKFDGPVFFFGMVWGEDKTISSLESTQKN
jgi:hypothetical protein